MTNPPNDLSAKFAGLQQQMALQHAGMMTVLNAINAKLNLSDLSAQLTNQHAALMIALTGISMKLDEVAGLRADVAGLRGEGPENTIKSVNQSLWNLAGPAPGKSLTDVWNKLDGIFGALGFGASPIPSYSLHQWLLSNLDGGSGLSLYNLLDALYLTSTELKNNVGEPTGDATTTALGLLASIQYALTTQQPATVLGKLEAIRACTCRTATALSPGAPDAACESPYVSSGTVFVPGVGISALFGTAATVASWQGSPPPGLTVSSGAIADNIYIQAADWSGWQIYVQTRAPNFGLIPGAVQRFPANQWVTLGGGNDTYSVFVDMSMGLTVYLCAPVVTVQCFVGSSVVSDGAYLSNMAGIQASLSDATLVSVGGYGSAAFSSSSTAGWTYKLLSYGGAGYVRVYASGTLINALYPANIGSSYAMPSPASTFYFVAFDAPFTFEICPPGVD